MGFVALAVIVTLMSAFLQYAAAPILMRQLATPAFREINKILRPISFVTANQGSQELEQRVILITSAEPFILPSSSADPSKNNRNDNSMATRPSSSKNIRAAQKETQGVIRDAKKNLSTTKSSPSEVVDKNPENKPSPKADDDPVDKVKLNSSDHKDEEISSLPRGREQKRGKQGHP